MDLSPDLELPLDRGAPWWYWLGGRPALDFVNTRRERWCRDVETLVRPDDLAEWLARAGLVAGAPLAPKTLLEAARGLREAIDSAVVAVTEGRPPPAEGLAVIDRWLPAALVPDRLTAEPDGPAILAPGAPADAVRHALGVLAHDAAEMLGTEQRERVRICASETCSARFYDRSRAGRRRWCSMTKCGNAAKARRHRARRADVAAEG
ncbi:MAG: ABATE domain-containing protein [Solirubrobacterales bacterium]|nr:ABATE domain-containing protein [Solirubrobacterales bacterium]MBV9716839.1 ABATE domain-containing protein [Solirubrobacterales bacterium]